MSDKRKIRTTMQPDKEIEVDEREYLDLQRQGLIHEGDADVGKPVDEPADRPAPQKRKADQ